MLLIKKSSQIYQAIRLLDEVLEKLKSFWIPLVNEGASTKGFRVS